VSFSFSACRGQEDREIQRCSARSLLTSWREFWVTESLPIGALVGEQDF
jgi:hypothetical protein